MDVTPEAIAQIAGSLGNDPTRLMDAIAATQARFGYLSDDAAKLLARALGLHYVEVLDTASFYTFFARSPQRRQTIRLSRTPISLMKGADAVFSAFERAAGDDLAVEWTSDIGMADQEPAGLMGTTVFTKLAPADAEPILTELRVAGSASTSPKAGFAPNLIRPGSVLFDPAAAGGGLERALAMTPQSVIDEVTNSGLRGRGGAGFSTGAKWRLTRQAQGSARYVVCNADEGEPGTFKDRLLLAQSPDLVFEGMTIGGYALGAKLGLVYLRAEYAHLFARLQACLAQRRRHALLGERILGRDGFDFEIRIEMGAGAYICGEESALLESLEGKRGAPRDRPPYPTDRGYLGAPTAVNNVETLACVSRILERGAAWFAGIGTPKSTGTKLMCLSGDCAVPGVYEVPFGITLGELLDLAGAQDVQGVQVSGAAGVCVAPKDFGRRLCYEDLSTDGATMVFGQQRNILEAVLLFAEFFEEESCGWCVPCRVGTVLLREQIQRVLAGRSSGSEIARLEKLANSVAKLSRCGLGQTAPNPILSTLADFPHLYQRAVHG